VRVAPRSILDRAYLVALSVSLADAILLAWDRLWGRTQSPAVYFGGDLEAYRAAAERLMQTGSPYSQALHAGPIDNVVANVPIAYLYPPPLAQAFVLLSRVPPGLLAVTSSLVQLAALAILLPLLYRRFAGPIGVRSLLAVLLVAVLSLPLEFATFGGNMSGWTTIAVALMLLRPGAAAGVTAPLIGLVKMTPAVLLVPAIVAPRSRRPAIAALAGATAISIAIAPRAWADWLSVLPNILRFPPAPEPWNFAPIGLFGSFGLPAVGLLIGYGLTAAAIAASAWLAHTGRWAAAVAAAVAALLFGPTSLWDHYLAITVPVLLAAWPMSGARTRPFLLMLAGVHLMFWLPVPPVMRGPALGCILAGSVAAIIVLAQGAQASTAANGPLIHVERAPRKGRSTDS
jgi:hypothetical protein